MQPLKFPVELSEYGHAPDDATVLELDGRLKMFIKLCGRYHSEEFVQSYLSSHSPSSDVSHRHEPARCGNSHDD